MKAKQLPRLTPSEFEIMSIVWEKGKTTVGAIMELINAKRKEQLRRSTIRVQVIRLAEKGWLKGEKLDSGLHYSAIAPRADASLRMVDEVRNQAFRGSYFELVKALFANSDVSSMEIEKIRNFIDEQQEGE
ncbi:MAG: BlaI/MecI/CopY family transcriptional regulator [Victivallales bacterium]|nr:BlaI/MecI/CopY family transcriptional regulator [Victivallales bacterium]